MTEKFNPFHLVEKSPWPLVASNTAVCIIFSGLLLLNKRKNSSLIIAFLTILIVAFLWWRDIHRESSSQGNHPVKVINGLKIGMILFITSEVFFFISFFWAFFHRRISPTVEIGHNWPPYSITAFNPIRIPLLNTILLLSSGVSVTWSHHALLNKNFSKAKNSLIATIILGIIFSFLQSFEYIEAPFCIADSSFGSRFFIATGFHGLHVIIGSIFLRISLTRIKRIINSNEHRIGFECAAWYWHFVDVVWLFLYSILYWWGAFLFSIKVHLISN